MKNQESKIINQPPSGEQTFLVYSWHLVGAFFIFGGCRMTITYERVRDLFKYENGELIWRKSKGAAKKNTIAGCISPEHRKHIRIDTKLYLAHRLIWLYHYGYLPENEIDHINKNPLDNRLENLREVSHVCNLRNCRVSKNNTSGVTGVIFDKNHNKWYSQIFVAGKTYNLGRRSNFNEAVLLRLAAEQCLGWDRCDIASPAFEYAVKNKLIKGIK